MASEPVSRSAPAGPACCLAEVSSALHRRRWIRVGSEDSQESGNVSGRAVRMGQPGTVKRSGAAAGTREHSPGEVDVPTAQADPQRLGEYLDARVGEVSGQRLQRVPADRRPDLGKDVLGGEREAEHPDLVWRQV